MEKQRSCAKCGKLIPWVRSEAVFCEECRAEVLRAGVIRPRTCRQCGITFEGGPRAWFCPECRRERRKEADRRKRKTKGRKLGSIQKCERCGGSYILASGRQKYCTDCAKVAVAETARAQSRERSKNYKAKRGGLRIARKANTRLCVVCKMPIPYERITRGIVTCSDACDKERKRITYNEVMVRKGKRKIPPEAHYVHTKPQSGIKGITWQNGKWQLKIRNKYIGVYETVEAAQKELIKRIGEKQQTDTK